MGGARERGDDPGANPYGTVGLSRGDLNKATLGMTAQHPVTLYTTAGGILGVIAATVLGPSLPLFGIAVGGLSLGAGSWIVNYFFRNESFARRYLERLHRQMEEHKQRVLQKVRASLEESVGDSDSGEFAGQGLEQIERIQEKFDNFRMLLDSKLNPTEITYGRYFGTAEQVVLSVLDNLNDMAGLLDSVRTIDTGYVRGRLKALKKLRRRSEADDQEASTLEARLALREEQLEKVNVLLTRNEEAMTSLDRTNAAIADMKTVKGRATMDMETSREQLEELAKRAKDYSLI